MLVKYAFVCNVGLRRTPEIDELHLLYRRKHEVKVFRFRRRKNTLPLRQESLWNVLPN